MPLFPPFPAGFCYEGDGPGPHPAPTRNPAESLPAMTDFVWIGPALLFGLLAVRAGLPPMVGYLVGGFLLSAFGPDHAPRFRYLGDLGVTLLLFTIGLKLDVEAAAVTRPPAPAGRRSGWMRTRSGRGCGPPRRGCPRSCR